MVEALRFFRTILAEAKYLAHDLNLLFKTEVEQREARRREWTSGEPGRTSSLLPPVVNAVLVQRIFSAFGLERGSNVLWVYGDDTRLKETYALTHGGHNYEGVGISNLLDGQNAAAFSGADCVIGHPYDLRKLASLRNGKVQLAIAYGDVLDSETRLQLEEYLANQVCDVYAASELSGPLGWSCPQTGRMHLNSDFFDFDLMPMGGPLAQITVTDRAHGLWSFDTGDVCRLGNERCGCGRSLRTVDSVEGRAIQCLHQGDSIVTPRQALNQLKASLGSLSISLSSANAVEIQLAENLSCDKRELALRTASLTGTENVTVKEVECGLTRTNRGKFVTIEVPRG